MRRQAEHFYEFGPFRLNAEERQLAREGIPVALTAKAFDTLLALVQNTGHILEKEELLKTVWPDTFVEEATLAQNIFLLRRALGEENGNKYIETIPKHGYRFVASVQEVSDENWDPFLEQTTRYAGAAAVGAVIEGCEEAEAVASDTTDRSVTDSDKKQMLTGSIPEPTTRAEELGTSRATSRSGNFINESQRNRLVALGMMALLLSAITIIAIGVYEFIGRPERQTESAGNSKSLEITRLTNSGKISVATISDDGKYLAYVVDDAGQQSIWLSQRATNSNVQILPPTEALLESLTFSHDGNYLYYGRAEDELPLVLANHVVYQVPILGGVSKKIISHVGSPISFSPDSKQIAFVRSYSSQETALIIANADGTGEQKLARRTKPDFFYGDFFTWYTGPAWSPDGRIIACAVGSSGTEGLSMTLVELNLEDGAERLITSQKWKIPLGLAWLSDGSGLVVNAIERDVKLIGGTRNSQIWHLSYPSGEAWRITSGSNEYRGIGVTADSSTMVTVQHNDLMSVWTIPNGDPSRIKQITSGANKYLGVSWTPDGRIVYGSPASGNPEIWIMNADGSNQKQLTDYAQYSSWPSVSPDGRYIVFTKVHNIWRMNLDGSDPRQLTGGLGEYFPRCSPDSKWVVYLSSKDSTLWKVSIGGGESDQLTFKPFASFPDISPDGKLIAFYYEDEQANPSRGVAVIPFEGGRPIKRFSIPSTASFFTRWTSDGHGVSYSDTRGGVSNIVVQPLTGGRRQLTDFKSGYLEEFDWSRDGRIAIIRGTETDDVVQIKGFR